MGHFSSIACEIAITLAHPNSLAVLGKLDEDPSFTFTIGVISSLTLQPDPVLFNPELWSGSELVKETSNFLMEKP